MLLVGAKVRASFVEYLENNNLFPTAERENKNHPHPHCAAKIIENLSGYKIGSLVKLNAKRRAKIADVLKSHLNSQRKKATVGSAQYDSNRHISLLQALAALEPKKTQP